MRECVGVRQIPGEAKRRWFSSSEFDLIVWYSGDQDNITSFELCYDKTHKEHSIIWSSGKGFSHMAVDDGENRPGKYKETPIMAPNGNFEARRVYSNFQAASRSLPDDVASFVLRTLEQHPDFIHPAA